MERLSHGPVRAGWSGESNPQAKGWLRDGSWGILVWEQQMMKFPITSSLSKEHVPVAQLWGGLLSTMLTLPSGSLGTQGTISRLARTARRWGDQIEQ